MCKTISQNKKKANDKSIQDCQAKLHSVNVKFQYNDLKIE